MDYTLSLGREIGNRVQGEQNVLVTGEVTPCAPISENGTVGQPDIPDHVKEMRGRIAHRYGETRTIPSTLGIYIKITGVYAAHNKCKQ